MSGPGTERLSNGYAATRRAFFTIGRGEAVRYRYRITDQYSGAFLRYETQTLVANKNTTKFSQLIYVNGSTYIISNASVTAVKTVSSSNYFNQFAKTGTQADDYFYF